MTTHEERVLGLARDAWRAGQPSDVRVEVAARRIAKRMQRPRRARATRRHTLILAFIVVFFGAAAWAASASAPQLFGLGPAAAPVKLTPAAPGALAAGVERANRPSQAPAEDTQVGVSSTSHDAKLTTPERKQARSGKAESPAPAASWREVTQALDAKDDTRTKQALEGLAKSSDPTTRAKARLGLAQLAKSRGDCGSAKRIAEEVARESGVETSVKKRAAALSAECD